MPRGLHAQPAPHPAHPRSPSPCPARARGAPPRPSAYVSRTHRLASCRPSRAGEASLWRKRMHNSVQAPQRRARTAQCPALPRAALPPPQRLRLGRIDLRHVDPLARAKRHYGASGCANPSKHLNAEIEQLVLRAGRAKPGLLGVEHRFGFGEYSRRVGSPAAQIVQSLAFGGDNGEPQSAVGAVRVLVGR